MSTPLSDKLNLLSMLIIIICIGLIPVIVRNTTHKNGHTYRIKQVCTHSHSSLQLVPHYQDMSNLNNVTYIWERYDICDSYRLDTVLIK